MRSVTVSVIILLWSLMKEDEIGRISIVYGMKVSY
jgi:hypothetical protein